MFGIFKRVVLGDEQSQGPGKRARFGFQVLKATKPEIDLEPWFDFICRINGREIDDGDPRLFQEEIRNLAGGGVNLEVWSAKGQQSREVILRLPVENPTLGVSLKWASLSITEDVWHVLDVSPGSPADTAGFLPYSDYIIGTPYGLVSGESGLGELVEDHIDRPLQLYVYNHEFNVTREVTILPRRNWGGEGALGCVLGFGALHRLPPPLKEPLSEPGQALFEYPNSNTPAPEDQTEYHFATPAFTAGSNAQEGTLSPPTMMDPSQLAAAARGSTTSPPTGDQPTPPPMSSIYSSGEIPQQTVSRPPRGKGRNTKHANFNLMDDYMQEEETKSKKDDYTVDDANIGGGSRSPPPPPPGGSRPGPPPPRKSEG